MTFHTSSFGYKKNGGGEKIHTLVWTLGGAHSTHWWEGLNDSETTLLDRRKSHPALTLPSSVSPGILFGMFPIGYYAGIQLTTFLSH